MSNVKSWVMPYPELPAGAPRSGYDMMYQNVYCPRCCSRDATLSTQGNCGCSYTDYNCQKQSAPFYVGGGPNPPGPFDYRNTGYYN